MKKNTSNAASLFSETLNTNTNTNTNSLISEKWIKTAWINHKKLFKRSVFISFIAPILTSHALSANIDSSLSNNQLDKVVVTSSKVKTPLREVGASMTIITREEIEKRGYQSLTAILANQVGISTTSSGGLGKPTALRIRGEEGYRTLVMIDGIELSDPTGTQVGPQIQHMLSTSDIERIEILRGPQGFIYGADSGGIINIITRKTQKPFEGAFETELGRYDTNNASGFLATANDNSHLLVSIADHSTDGFNVRTDDLSNDLDGYENTTLHTRWEYQLSNSTSIRMNLRDIEANSEYDNCFPASNVCDTEFDQTSAKVDFTHQFKQFDTQLGFSHSTIERENFTEGLKVSATEGDTTKLDFLMSFPATNHVDIILGADYEDSEIISFDGRELSRNQEGLFAELQAAPQELLTLTLGLRHDGSDEFGEHTSIRSTGAYLHEFDTLTLKYRTSIGTGFRAPSLSEIAYNAGPFAFGEASETTLKEEQSKGYDVGVDVYTSGGSSFGVTYFDQRITDEIFFDLAAFSGYLQQDGQTRSRGVEVSFEHPVTYTVTVFGHATYNKTLTRENEQRIRRPEKVGNLGIDLAFLQGKLNLLGNLRVVRDAIDEIFGVGTVALDDYELIDISLQYRVNRELGLHARLENALDENYEQVTGFSTPGRAIIAGFKFNF